MARREGIEAQLPSTTRCLDSVESQEAVAVIWHRGRFLIVKRRGAKVLRDFWELPGGEFNQVKDLKRALARRIRCNLGLKVRMKDLLVTLKHSITKHRITVQAFLAELNSSDPVSRRGRNSRWVRLSEVNRYPFGSASVRILKALRDRKASGIG